MSVSSTFRKCHLWLCQQQESFFGGGRSLHFGSVSFTKLFIYSWIFNFLSYVIFLQSEDLSLAFSVVVFFVWQWLNFFFSLLKGIFTGNRILGWHFLFSQHFEDVVPLVPTFHCLDWESLMIQTIVPCIQSGRFKICLYLWFSVVALW